MIRSFRRLPLPLDLFGAIALIVGLAWLALLWRGEPGEVAGFARVIDGDSLAIDGRDVRLFGIDAPELHQLCERGGRPWPCGEAAKRRLGELAASRFVRCTVRDTDRYRRAVSDCRAGGEDLGQRMVEAGLAVAERGYFTAEVAARAAGRGIWAGGFERPAEWRRAHRGH
ncbi:thermonuclease family protein [Blastochloris viridis]|uniref:Succinoglycan biosynthesis protein n=1 Tax=Blastochloris viridis TaxID=1079 RepID=A0A0H5B7B5_BLAVI|nr:thermonuclease family protein [Blastochloris viridis]ALK08645.1 Succinoglycan biosynthesis protein ExoI [Blastochloris viridis]BAR98062.1 succinoglycan biosynthesis protein [Blastochloris viridis]CUU41308.1 hypothetical protein BVIRIDIS_02970 [Blastochloris viridis]